MESVAIGLLCTYKKSARNPFYGSIGHRPVISSIKRFRNLCNILHFKKDYAKTSTYDVALAIDRFGLSKVKGAKNCYYPNLKL